MQRFASLFAFALSGFTTLASAQDLIVDGTTLSLGGTHRYETVRVINGGRILVPPFNGIDRESTGNLVLIADSILIDATSRIDARGAGYTTPRCSDGRGPGGEAGGAGGCAVQDSGGGGAHFGRGGRGTKDCNLFGSATSCQFPQEFQEDCGNTLNMAGTACSSSSDCRGPSSMWDGEPTVSGSAYRHSIYAVEFGASGGDKGCRDNDGFGTQPAVGGSGGGRVVLAALTPTATGTVQIDGTITASGKRGCGTGNDSGGGGAGGSILIVGDQVQVGGGASVSARGGLGGDTFAASSGQPDFTDCPAGAQTGGTCDDCGGGGGGGIINVLSRTSTLDYEAAFDVGGADGGVCAICRGEAGGGAGELLLDGAYVGEFCDGFDNDFDGSIDEGLGTTACGLGSCQRDIAACTAGAPVSCSPIVDADPSCRTNDAGARPRIAVVLDTSSSMLLDLDGYPTFGDGSTDRPGIDTNGNGEPDDSRLYLARTSLANVISSYPEIDFALARYHQDQGPSRSCQTAKWFECQGLIGTYDNPTDNTGDAVCTVAISTSGTVTVREVSNGGEECINYAGTCGPPRRGADVLSGFGAPTRDVVRWLDGRETGFDPDTTPGDVCAHTRAHRDCEVRASGETPLGGSLQAVEDYMVPIRATDPSSGCRDYSIILVTDGAESCGGDPVAQATRLFTSFGIQTYVIAVSVLPTEEGSLNAIASAGSGGARTRATFVRNPEDLVPAITAILEGSIRTERCNGMDDDCDTRIDEGFALGQACRDSRVGACRGSGITVCAASELATECRIDMPGASPGDETCNSLDDDCDEAIDEGLTCTGSCTPTGDEVCNGVDDDCNGLIDEVDPRIGVPCGIDTGECAPGTQRCVTGSIMCIGGIGPRDEVCNGLDDDCDGESDDLAACPAESMCIEGGCRRPCDPDSEFACPLGFECRPPEGSSDPENAFCIPTACASCTAQETCIDNTCVDLCADVTCDAGLLCRGGNCLGCELYRCPNGQVCSNRVCVPDRCSEGTCGPREVCLDGTCQAACGPNTCPSGQRCSTSGACEEDPCEGVTCESGWVCISGTCEMDPCRGLRCAPTQICVPALGCVADPCDTAECPSGAECRVAANGAVQCNVAVPDGMGTRVLAAGGGGLCSAAAGMRSSSWGASFLVLFALGLLRIRRTGR